MDPLSDILSLLKPVSYVSAGFDAGGDWSLQFADLGECIKCYAVVSGACWLSIEEISEEVLLKAGDCFVLPGVRTFCLASELGLPPTEAGPVFSAAQGGGVVVHGGGGDCFLVGSRFAVRGDDAGLLLKMFPPIVHIKRKSDQDALRWAVERMMREMREQRPGSFLVVQHLAHMMLVQALRLHLAEGAKGCTGWLLALADEQIGAALSAIHAAPDHRWTLPELASKAHMSRSTFAHKFKEIVGISPIHYLTRWRMLLAGDRLRHSNDSISTISLALGYESESAFCTAFKREMGCTPRQYGRQTS